MRVRDTLRVAMYTTLIEAADLALHYRKPGWVVVDCRFDLACPQWGAEAYAAGHVPNAVYASLDRHLSGAVTQLSGRHPLPAIESFARTLGDWGIGKDTQVIAYDQSNSAYAARLWWLLRWAGHQSVAVLNGGLAAWQRAGLPVTTELATQEPRRFVSAPQRSGVMTTAQLQRVITAGDLNSGQRALVDARAADRFAGENETLDPVAGHIPGARNAPFSGNLDAQGRFLPAVSLRGRWLSSLQGVQPTQVIATCGSGVTACHNLLALEVAGLSGAQLYAGSWSEWIRDPARPIARGP
jgi:thiosulfate/3-mercaptopyruvate sulfurtransferase